MGAGGGTEGFTRGQHRTFFSTGMFLTATTGTITIVTEEKNSVE